jgi:hypothetical protein
MSSLSPVRTASRTTSGVGRGTGSRSGSTVSKRSEDVALACTSGGPMPASPATRRHAASVMTNRREPAGPLAPPAGRPQRRTFDPSRLAAPPRPAEPRTAPTSARARASRTLATPLRRAADFPSLGEGSEPRAGPGRPNLARYGRLAGSAVPRIVTRARATVPFLGP